MFAPRVIDCSLEFNDYIGREWVYEGLKWEYKELYNSGSLEWWRKFPG